MSAAPILERDFQAQVLELAKILGWKSAHFRAARTAKGWRTPVGGDGKGFPDLILLRGARLIVAELKTTNGTLRPEQREWMSAWYSFAGGVNEEFGVSAVDVCVWRPEDFDTIAELLR